MDYLVRDIYSSGWNIIRQCLSNPLPFHWDIFVLIFTQPYNDGRDWITAEQYLLTHHTLGQDTCPNFSHTTLAIVDIVGFYEKKINTDILLICCCIASYSYIPFYNCVLHIGYVSHVLVRRTLVCVVVVDSLTTADAHACSSGFLLVTALEK